MLTPIPRKKGEYDPDSLEKCLARYERRYDELPTVYLKHPETLVGAPDAYPWTPATYLARGVVYLGPVEV